MSEPQDTQFSGFASALFDELYSTGELWFDAPDDGWKEQWKTVIARHAYRLVEHAATHMLRMQSDGVHHIMMSDIPDLDPKVTKFHNGLSPEQIIELLGYIVEVYIPQSKSWEQRYVVGVDFSKPYINGEVVEVDNIKENETYSYPGNARRKIKLRGDEIYSRLRLLKVVEAEEIKQIEDAQHDES